MRNEIREKSAEAKPSCLIAVSFVGKTGIFARFPLIHI
jgi:hypothetical protein